MGMPPMTQPRPAGIGDNGGPPMGGMGDGGPMDFAGSLQQLRDSLPPEMQSKLDPSNPITQLLFKRLRDGISEQEGQALLMLIDGAEGIAPGSLGALKKVLPEIYLLLDLFDDGELNNSVGDDGGGAMGDGMPVSGGPPRARPESSQPAPRPSYAPTDGEDEEDDEPYGGSAASRLSAIRA